MPIIEGTCAGCKKPIVWGQLPDGTKVPLDPRPATYLILAPGADHYKIQRATCPQADAFSRGNKAGEHL